MHKSETGDSLASCKKNPEGELRVGEWARGFLGGMMLTPEQWQPAFDHELGRKVLLPIAAVGAHERCFDLFISLIEERPVDGTRDLVIALGTPFCAEYLPRVWADIAARAGTKVSPCCSPTTN